MIRTLIGGALLIAYGLISPKDIAYLVLGFGFIIWDSVSSTRSMQDELRDRVIDLQVTLEGLRSYFEDDEGDTALKS